MKIRTRFARFAGLFALLLAGCGPAGPHDDSPVIARVDGEAVSAAEIDALAERLSAGAPRKPPADREVALEAWIRHRILQAEVEAREIDQREAYRQRVLGIEGRAFRGRQELARNAIINALTEELAPSEEDLRARYEKYADRFRTTQVQLRQIVVESREELNEARKRIARGESFEAVAREQNLDPALRASGGDLGWLEQRKLPTTVIGPAHKLIEPGQVSDPFRDREGRWNLVQLVGKQDAVLRDFESVRDQLEYELRVVRSREAVEELLGARREAVKVERLSGFERTPPPAPPADAPPASEPSSPTPEAPPPAPDSGEATPDSAPAPT